MLSEYPYSTAEIESAACKGLPASAKSLPARSCMWLHPSIPEFDYDLTMHWNDSSIGSTGA